jgi:hypothetical protein
MYSTENFRCIGFKTLQYVVGGRGEGDGCLSECVYCRSDEEATNVVVFLGGSVEGNLDESGLQRKETNVELSRDHHSFVSLQKLVSCTCFLPSLNFHL